MPIVMLSSLRSFEAWMFACALLLSLLPFSMAAQVEPTPADSAAMQRAPGEWQADYEVDESPRPNVWPDRLASDSAYAHYGPINRFLAPARSYDPQRFWTSIGVSSAISGGLSAWLWKAWYAKNEIGPFKTIDDRGEWEGMDKLGHIYSTYQYARLSYRAARWTGTHRKRSLLIATGVGLGLQTTVEIMDGHSQAWGFSVADMAANAAGAGLFASQQLLWDDQRIRLKFGYTPQRYPHTPIPSSQGDGSRFTLRQRADALYGTTLAQRLVKDYNAQTIWLSANPAVLFGRSRGRMPWLNLAVGYSANDVYGAHGNNWGRNGYALRASEITQRGREYALSLDIDLERLPVKNPVLRTVLTALNLFKVPAPALLYQQASGRLQWSWLYM